MSEALIGVLIGGLLSGLGTWITMFIQHKRWISETQIARLNAKRERFEVAYEVTLEKLQKDMLQDVYSSNMMSDIDFLFPEIVSQAFENFMAEKDRSDDTMRNHYYGIARAMKKSLKSIDDQIDAIVLGNK